MKPLSEYEIKGSFRLGAVTTNSSTQGLYEDSQGGQFHILPPFQGQKPDKPRVFKYLHVKTLTYAYKDTEGNEYQPYPELAGSLKDEEFQKSRTCDGCGISHLLMDCPMRIQKGERTPPESAKEGPTAANDQKKESPKMIAQSSPKAPRSPPKSPPKRQILPQSTTDLLKSQVINLQANNAGADLAKDTTFNKELKADQKVDMASKKDIEASSSQQQKGVATNVQSKPTASTWLQFEVIAKSGVKVPCMALVDLEGKNSFMSYGTWVISGQPTLDKDHKTIQACGKSSEGCLGLAKSTIHLNSQPLLGEFYVMDPKHRQKELILGGQLAKAALCLQQSQVVQEKCQQQTKPRVDTTTQEPAMTRMSPIIVSPTKEDTHENVHKGEQIALKDIKPNKEGTIEAALRMLEPVKDTGTNAAKVDNKSQQGLKSQWVKKENCLKGEAATGPSKAMPLVPQAQSKPSTQAVNNGEDMYVPPARIVMNIRHQKGPQLQRLALIDMSAGKNLLSHKTWCMLGKPKLESTNKFV